MAGTDQNTVLIYLSGNNGSGKSTIGRNLASRLGFSHLPEENPDRSYLCDLFSQPKRWSFEAQAHFLTFKAGLVKHSTAEAAKVFIDRSPYEDAEIFARYFHQMRRLDIRAYRTYQQLYIALIQELPEPNLIIYCQCSIKELEHRVSQRGRDYEQLYPKNHLRVLDQLYRSWVERTCRRYPGKVFALDTETHNFLTDHEALDKLAADIRYILTSSPRDQLDLFPANDSVQSSLFNEIRQFYGMLTPLVPTHRATPTSLLRKPIAYIAAPFTGKATEPDQTETSSSEAQPSLESWVQPAPPHGKIRDATYKEYLVWIESIARQAGYQTFLPHRDVNKWGDRTLTPSQGAAECTKHVFESDVLIALPQLSLGAHYEVGIAIGYGLPVIILMSSSGDTSFIMQGLGSQPNVSVLIFASPAELRERLTTKLTELAAHPLR